MNLNVATMQDPGSLMQTLIGEGDVWPTVAVFDELGQPVAYTALLADIGSIDYHPADDGGVYFKEFVAEGRTRPFKVPGTVSVTIGPNAFSGRAKVHGNVLTGLGGIPYCEPTIEHIWIWKESHVPLFRIAAESLKVSSHDVHYEETFNATITINDVYPDAHVVAIEFNLEFDTLALEALQVVEGDFVKQFGESFFTSYINDGVLVGTIQLPPWPGENGWMRESGTICTIEFKAIHEAPYGSPLTLTNAFVVSADGNDLEFRRLIHGYVTIIP